MAKLSAPKKVPADGADLRSLGRRLERLMREREGSEKLRVEAGETFKKIAPKITPSHANRSENTVIQVWDALIDPVDAASKLSMEIHWTIVQHMFDTERVLPFASVKAMAKKSGYAAAAERVRSIDIELKSLASRALKMRAASFAGAKTQALAFLALDQVRYGWSWTFDRKDVLALSRSVVALSNAREART